MSTTFLKKLLIFFFIVFSVLQYNEFKHFLFSGKACTAVFILQKEVIHEKEKTLSTSSLSTSPYREYIRVVFPEDSVWSEAYFYGSGKQIDAKLYTRVQGVVDQKTSRVYPYGYKEASNFSPEGTEEKDGKTFDVYTSEYQVNLNETLGLPDSYDILNAPVSQKYYVDPDNDTVSYICTDLTDLQGRSSLALDIAYGDLSEAEASRILEEDQTRHIEILEILETGDSVEVTVP